MLNVTEERDGRWEQVNMLMLAWVAALYGSHGEHRRVDLIRCDGFWEAGDGPAWTVLHGRVKPNLLSEPLCLVDQKLKEGMCMLCKIYIFNVIFIYIF